MDIGIVNGPNLDRLGKREPEVYGSRTLADLEAEVRAHAAKLGLKPRFFQSNHEGEIIDTLAKWTDDGVKLLVINPGGHTHVSVALRDAISGSGMRAVEVHISNPNAREPWRHTSVVAPVATGSIMGLGIHGYELAVEAIVRRLAS